MSDTAQPKRTALFDAHLGAGARMVPFAGYEMPLQYKAGIMAEHAQVRDAAGLFDVSHMGQLRITGKAGADPMVELERLLPSNLREMAPGQTRYTVLLNEVGGIVDDLMVTRDPANPAVTLAVINASRIEADLDHLRSHLGDRLAFEHLESRALIALQGPKAAAAAQTLFPETATQRFMTTQHLVWEGEQVTVTRCGYTGEDGFEFSIANDQAAAFLERLLALPDTGLCGLGARDSLRLEAGLCLYGHDMDEATSPIEADLGFVIQKRRRTDSDFLGAERIADELSGQPSRLRVGIAPEGRAPVREGSEILHPQTHEVIGAVTSGGFSPSLGRPIAMGYVAPDDAAIDTPLLISQRGKTHPAVVAQMPFMPHRYYRALPI